MEKKKLKLILGICIPLGMILFVVAPIVMVIIYLNGTYSYKGEHKDLYTTAVSNIFGVQGFSHNGETFYEPVVDIIEKDEYGRTLFLYQELTYKNEPGYFGGLVIMQKSDDSYAYFVENCYLPIYTPSITKLDYQTLFTQEQISELKSLNDWSKDINTSKLLTSSLTSKKQEGQLSITNDDFENAINEHFKNKGEDKKIRYKYSSFCNCDKSGKELLLVSYSDKNVSSYKDYNFAMIFNNDKSCPTTNIIEIDDVKNTETILKTLKQNSNWVR